jgi:hypothetical protein
MSAKGQLLTSQRPLELVRFVPVADLAEPNRVVAGLFRKELASLTLPSALSARPAQWFSVNLSRGVGSNS